MFFSKYSKPKYQEILLSNKKNRDLDAFYTLNVCPGGSQGRLNERVLEIFYGSRPFDAQRRDPFSRTNLSFLVEYGARLHYYLMDNGRAATVLYPAKTDNYAPIEDSILVSINFNPHHFYVKYARHFRLLNAYMRCTCLDGEPSYMDRMKVGILRFCRPMIIEGKQQPTRLYIWTTSIIKFALTVGLSGFLLLLIQSFMVSPPLGYSSQLSHTNKTLNLIDKKIDVIYDSAYGFHGIRPNSKSKR